MPLPLIPGMLNQKGARFVGLKDGKPMWANIHYVKPQHNGTSLVANDPATLGCALFAVRKAYDDPYLSVQYVNPDTEPNIKEYGIMRPGWMLIGSRGLLANDRGEPLWHHNELGILSMAYEMAPQPEAEPETEPEKLVKGCGLIIPGVN